MPTVLITGCSSGIGRALADAFRDAGHEVWATARKPEDVEQLAAAGFTARQLDVNDGEALKRLADELEAQHGRLTCWSTTPATAPWARCSTAASMP